MSFNEKRYFDPLYGAVALTDFEYSLLFLPEVQRLRYVRMCNINSLLVTGASEISRFEHVLGVMRLAKEWLGNNGQNLSEIERSSFLSAAILHDFQTGPFGHSLQYVLEETETEGDFRHEDVAHGHSQNFHQKADAAASFAGQLFQGATKLSENWQEISNLIEGSGKLGPLISGTIDLDNIDNVVRLAYHVGVASREDAEIALEMARDFRPKNGMLEVSSTSLPLITRWQDIRSRLYHLLLLDWAEFSAKAMLTKAIETLIDLKFLGSDVWKMTDLEFLEHIERTAVGEGQEAKNLAQRVRRGDLYAPLFLGEIQGTDLYESLNVPVAKRQLEKDLRQEINTYLGASKETLVHYIKDKGKTNRRIDVVLRGTNEKVSLGASSDRTLIGVFINGGSGLSYEHSYFVIKRFFEKRLKVPVERLEDPIIAPEAERQMELL